jgi:hypothetical protein
MAQGLGPRAKASGRSGTTTKVDVVGHQAIAEHAPAAAAAPLGEQLTVGVAIGIVKKNGLAGVPPLRNVVRDTDRNQARDAWPWRLSG